MVDATHIYEWSINSATAHFSWARGNLTFRRRGAKTRRGRRTRKKKLEEEKKKKFFLASQNRLCRKVEGVVRASKGIEKNEMKPIFANLYLVNDPLPFSTIYTRCAACPIWTFENKKLVLRFRLRVGLARNLLCQLFAFCPATARFQCSCLENISLFPFRRLD